LQTKGIIKSDDTVIVTKMNHIVEVQYMEKMNDKCPIKKLNKDNYLVLDTGEIKEFEHIKTRKDSICSLKQTFKKLRYLINNNFSGKPNELHVVLTYAENMTDTKRLYRDFKNFMDRLKYNFKGQSSIDYISVIEPQKRGAWHSHLLLRFNDLDTVYIENKKLAELWGHGFVKIRSLKDVDNIGAYLSAYLTDVELINDDILRTISDKKEVTIKKVDGKEKMFIKGGRLHMYPPGMNLFRKSKGIVYPERTKMKYAQVKKEIVGNRDPHYSRSISIKDNDFENTIIHEQYNMKRM
jgi:hypothetical protein